MFHLPGSYFGHLQGFFVEDCVDVVEEAGAVEFVAVAVVVVVVVVDDDEGGTTSMQYWGSLVYKIDMRTTYQKCLGQHVEKE